MSFNSQPIADWAAPAPPPQHQHQQQQWAAPAPPPQSASSSSNALPPRRPRNRGGRGRARGPSVPTPAGTASISESSGSEAGSSREVSPSRAQALMVPSVFVEPNNNNNNNNRNNNNNNRNNNNRNNNNRGGNSNALAVAAVAFNEDTGLDVGRLSAMFESEGFKLTNTLLAKVKDACRLFRCNHCRAHYDRLKELTDHLKAYRSHLVNPSVIKLRKLALIQRVHGPNGTDDERQFPLEFEKLTSAQKRTLIELAIDRAYFERIRRFL